MRFFVGCCRSNDAVYTSVDQRKLDDDFKAVKWLRDRELERNSKKDNTKEEENRKKKLFRCCYSNDAVYISKEPFLKEHMKFDDDDLKAVKWIRDREFERNSKNEDNTNEEKINKKNPDEEYKADDSSEEAADSEMILKDLKQEEIIYVNNLDSKSATSKTAGIGFQVLRWSPKKKSQFLKIHD